jgi:hypothetical protein
VFTTGYSHCSSPLDYEFAKHTHDLERKLETFRKYYNQNRVHQSLAGNTPAVVSGISQTQYADLSNYSWISHYNELFQTPIAA